MAALLDLGIRLALAAPSLAPARVGLFCVVGFVAGTWQAAALAVLDKPATDGGHRVYNLGASRSEDIMHVIELFERSLGKKAVIELKPGEPGDMQETSADITATTRDFGWAPKVAVEEGIPKFVEWFRGYNRL